MAKRTKRLIENSQTDDTVRINKYLSDAGVCSRREADRFITSGEVTVDGEIANIGTKVSIGQKVVFQGKPINKDEQLVLIAFNKPRGIVCTTDTSEKDNIIDYINYGKRIYPVGRLDKDSEGLILLTNDGNIVNKILRAGNNHEKEYIVTLNKQITSEFLKGMAAGVPILDTITRPCVIKALDKFTFQIILTQGLNRQIRRMCEHFDYKVLSLQRIRIMNINLGHMQIGGYRNVTDKEIEGLKVLMSESVNSPYLPDDEDGEVYSRMPQESTYDKTPAPQRKEKFVSNQTKDNRSSNSSYKRKESGKNYSDRKSNNFDRTKTGTSTRQKPYADLKAKPGTGENSRNDSDLRSKAGTETRFKSGNDTRFKSGTDTRSKTGNENRFKTGNDTRFKTGTDTRSKTGSDNRFKTSTDTRSKTGSDNRFKAGTDARSKTGNDTRFKTGTDTRSKTGSENRFKAGTDTRSKTGNDTRFKAGTDSRSKTGSENRFKAGTDTRSKNGNFNRFKAGSDSRSRTAYKSSRGNK